VARARAGRHPPGSAIAGGAQFGTHAHAAAHAADAGGGAHRGTRQAGPARGSPALGPALGPALASELFGKRVARILRFTAFYVAIDAAATGLILSERDPAVQQLPLAFPARGTARCLSGQLLPASLRELMRSSWK
jgi:hypothetical protein